MREEGEDRPDQLSKARRRGWAVGWAPLVSPDHQDFDGGHGPPESTMNLQMKNLALALATWLMVSIAAPLCCAAEATEPSLDVQFKQTVEPFVHRYCFDCHGEAKQEAKLDLRGYASIAAIAKEHRTWDLVLERLAAGEMPPEEAERQPTPEERGAVVGWIKAFRDEEARRHAGDPGPVLARRLSNAEFDYTVRDLTGVDIRPTREFPVDPANEAGFDNSGESLTMSPALVKKYLAAARHVADHVVLKPHGFVFAPHPAVTETDRDKYCVRRIIDFYERHRVDYADYFFALAEWRNRQGDRTVHADALLEQLARESKLSANYLKTLWAALNQSEESRDGAVGPLAALRAMWRELPMQAGERDELRRRCQAMREFVVNERKKCEPKVEKLLAPDISSGSQPLVLWRNGRLAALHREYSGGIDDEALRTAWSQFCQIFPDAFVVSDRGPYFDPKAAGQGRLLTAGFHLMQGYFRDDRPLYDLVLDEAEQRELDELWQELNFVTLVPERQYKDFIFFERAEPPRFMGESEFDFARSEDKDATSPKKIAKLAEAYLAKAKKLGAQPEAIAAIETYFADISAQIRWVDETRRAAEPSHLEALARFAERAYRRPLSSEERDELLAFYRLLRQQDELSHEDAMRDALASILVSPHFCYRFDLAAEGSEIQPLSPYALASRLSYFLWSSMPDDELLAHAAAGDLRRPEVLLAQTRRMLADDRIRGLATEFAGNWLEFRRFEEHNGVDRERFASFTNELRQAMFEEPLRFFIDVVRENRPALDFLYADRTFVNPVLARHYGMPEPSGGPDDWRQVDDASRYGRGGLLPMAAFLTKNSPGLRTSPVKRGYWVVRRLLGEHIPPPPPEVPELPKDEAQLGELTLPQVLARHREHKACAGCHDRFDSVGLAFEGYGPIGERRERDLGGRPIESHALFPGGSQGDGLDGLRRYLRERRQDDFVDNLCRKLLAYSLGRGLLLSDEPLIGELRARLAADGYRLGGLVERIVASPQFLNQRGSSEAND